MLEYDRKMEVFLGGEGGVREAGGSLTSYW